MTHTIKRFGVPGQGTWQGSDEVWHFEDAATYYLSADRIPVRSDVASHLAQRKRFRQSWDIAVSRTGTAVRRAASRIRQMVGQNSAR